MYETFFSYVNIYNILYISANNIQVLIGLNIQIHILSEYWQNPAKGPMIMGTWMDRYTQTNRQAYLICAQGVLSVMYTL